MSRSARVAQVGLWLAIAGGLALALAPVGYREDWWSLRVSLFYLLGGAIAIGALAVIVSLVGVFLTRRTPGMQGFRLALACVVLGAVVGGYPAAQLAKARRLRPIHDVSTGTAIPSVCGAVPQARRSAPNGRDSAGGTVA